MGPFSSRRHVMPSICSAWFCFPEGGTTATMQKKRARKREKESSGSYLMRSWRMAQFCDRDSRACRFTMDPDAALGEPWGEPRRCHRGGLPAMATSQGLRWEKWDPVWRENEQWIHYRALGRCLPPSLWSSWSVVLFWGSPVIWPPESHYCSKGISWGLEPDVWCFLRKAGHKDVGESGSTKSSRDALPIHRWLHCRTARWCRLEESKILGTCVTCPAFSTRAVIEGLCQFHALSNHRLPSNLRAVIGHSPFQFFEPAFGRPVEVDALISS